MGISCVITHLTTISIDIIMKMFICIALLAVAAGADKCEFGHTWLQGQQGSLEVTVPADTIKWVVEMTFDKAPKHIHAHQGRDEGCDKEESVCRFGSENHNEELKAGDVLELPYQIQFDEDPEAPKVTSVVFKYCDAEPCDEESMQEYPVPEDTEEWEVTLIFSGPIGSLDAHQGLDEACEGEVCTFTNESWNGVLAAGNVLELTYQATFEETEDHPELVSIAFNGQEACAEE